MNATFRKLIAASLIFFGLLPWANADWNVSSQSIKSLLPTAETNSVKLHFVQIFSSSNPTKAEGMKNTLAMQGFKAFVKVGKQKPRTYYQVQVGPFVSKQSALNAKMSIIQLYPQFLFLNDAIIR